MEKIAEQIKEGLIQNLSEESSFYTPQELLSSGVPAVVVETLRRNISDTIESGMNLPESDWVDTKSGKVVAAWEHFVTASKNHIKIPSSKISALIAEAVEQCLELAAKPRQAVPEIIFKSRKKRDLGSLKKSVENLTINQQLGYALLRYMEKKEKNELTLDQAREVVKKIDQKLIEDYHPLKWANTLKPLFDIAGPAIDSELLRIYFEDKEMYVEAKKFDMLDHAVDETEFIEIMSSAELLQTDSESQGQSQLFEMADENDTIVSDEESQPTIGKVDEHQEKLAEGDSESKDEKTDLKEEKPDTDEADSDLRDETDKKEIPATKDSGEPLEEPVEEQENIVDLFSEINREKPGSSDMFYLEKRDETKPSVVESEESEIEGDNITLLNKFVFDESVSDESADDEDHTDAEDEKEPSSIYEEMNLVKENRNRAERMSDIFDSEPEESEDDEPELVLSYKVLEVEDEEDDTDSLASESKPQEEDMEDFSEKTETDMNTEDDSDEEDDDLPMWRSFLERDDIETESGYEYEEETETGTEGHEEPDDDFIEEPIYDLTAEESDPDEKLQEISKWLDDERQRFIEEIFSNSEMAYEQALLEIMDFNNWKSASHYLEKEIFSRNRIDVYDEAAVDFTDRLHSYFMQNK